MIGRKVLGVRDLFLVFCHFGFELAADLAALLLFVKPSLCARQSHERNKSREVKRQVSGNGLPLLRANEGHGVSQPRSDNKKRSTYYLFRASLPSQLLLQASGNTKVLGVRDLTSRCCEARLRLHGQLQPSQRFIWSLHIVSRHLPHTTHCRHSQP